MTSQFPYEIKNVTAEEDMIIKKYYKDYSRSFIRVGPNGYIAMAGYGDHAADIYSLEVRPSDVWVVSFSRSGTTWLQELVWLVHNNLDYQALKDSDATRRFAFIEYPTLEAEIKKKSTSSGSATVENFKTIGDVPSPRYIKSHLPLSLLPPKLLDTAKVFYIARDPRDVAVSFHFAHQMFRYFDDTVTLKEFWDLFKNDLIMHTPIFPHIKEAWDQRTHPNLFFLFYEEMKKDLSSVIDKVCTFLGKDYTAEQKLQLAHHLSFDNMKKNSPIIVNKGNEEKNFFRKGKSGGWPSYFDEQMQKEAEEFLSKNLELTDMRFPVVE